MKAFLIRTLLFLTILVFVSWLVKITGFYIQFLPSTEVYDAIAESKKKVTNKSKTLLIGDSVGKQLFDSLKEQSDTVTSLACNQAIDVVGHYLLLHEFLKHNKDIEKVILIFNPFSLGNDIDHEFTFNYFLKPFNNQYYRSQLSQHVKNQIRKIPFYYLSQFPPVTITFWAPTFNTNGPKKGNGLISQTSFGYLQKMIELLESKDIQFVFYAAPIKKSRKTEVEQIFDVYQSSSFQSPYLDDYFSNIIYLDDSLFFDHIHYHDATFILNNKLNLQF